MAIVAVAAVPVAETLVAGAAGGEAAAAVGGAEVAGAAGGEAAAAGEVEAASASEATATESAESEGEFSEAEDSEPSDEEDNQQQNQQNQKNKKQTKTEGNDEVALLNEQNDKNFKEQTEYFMHGADSKGSPLGGGASAILDMLPKPKGLTAGNMEAELEQNTETMHSP